MAKISIDFPKCPRCNDDKDVFLIRFSIDGNPDIFLWFCEYCNKELSWRKEKTDTETLYEAGRNANAEPTTSGTGTISTEEGSI